MLTEEDWDLLGSIDVPISNREPVKLHNIPKGSMCASCKHANRNCYHLDFASMRAIESFDDFVVVRCEEFDRRTKG